LDDAIILKDKGYSIQQLKDGGYTMEELVEAGWVDVTY
jgi:biotin operon repressor